MDTPMHPGAVLKDLYLDPMAMSPIALARHIGVPRTRIERLVKGTTSLTPDTALRLARAFGNRPVYWMTMQAAYDTAMAAQTVDVSDIAPLQMG